MCTSFSAQKWRQEKCSSEHTHSAPPLPAAQSQSVFLVCTPTYPILCSEADRTAADLAVGGAKREH